MHKDKHDQPLRKGFYLPDGNHGHLASYFTGEFDVTGGAIVEDHFGVGILSPEETSQLLPLDQTVYHKYLDGYAEAILLSRRYFERKCSQLEREAQQSLPLPKNVSRQSDTPEDDIPF